MCILSSCSFADQEQRCKQEAAKGLRAYQTQHYAESADAYSAAADAAKQSGNSLQYPLMLRELSRAYLGEAKFKQAEEALQKALAAYSVLDKQDSFKGYEISVLKERQYETLAMLGDCYMAEKNYTSARDTYFQTITLGSSIAEQPSNAIQVNQKYINALEKCGQHELAEQMQRRADAASLTLDEFDDRISTIIPMMHHGKVAAAEKEIELLHMASKGFIGKNPREARILTYVALSDIMHNQVAQAQSVVEGAINTTKAMNDSAADWSAQHTLMGLCRELQGDTAGSIGFYSAAFRMEAYHPNEILEIVENGLKENGFSKQAAIVEARLKWFRTNPAFRLVPTNALQFVWQANDEDRNGQPQLANESRLKGLQHLESGPNLISADEFKGAYRLYKHYQATGEKDLEKRALEQMRVVGRRSHDGRLMLDRALSREGLKF